MKALKLKICGMRQGDNIRAVEKLRPDLMGFICWEKSPRFVDITPDYLPQYSRRTGVFVNPSVSQISAEIARLGLSLVQLHGHETPKFCLSLRQYLNSISRQVAIIKAFSVPENGPFPDTTAYETVCNYFLFDTSCHSYGGSGRRFNWSTLDNYHGRTPFWLSGGIGPDATNALDAFFHPCCIGIDLNSRFETSPGLKDITTLKAFISELREKAILTSDKQTF